MSGILLAIWLIIMGLGQLGVWSAPGILLGLLALLAGILMLAPVVVRVSK